MNDHGSVQVRSTSRVATRRDAYLQSGRATFVTVEMQKSRKFSPFIVVAAIGPGRVYLRITTPVNCHIFSVCEQRHVRGGGGKKSIKGRNCPRVSITTSRRGRSRELSTCTPIGNPERSRDDRCITPAEIVYRYIFINSVFFVN